MFLKSFFGLAATKITLTTIDLYYMLRIVYCELYNIRYVFCIVY